MNFGQVEEQLSLGLGRDDDFAPEDDENMEKEDTPNIKKPVLKDHQ